ncbi:hypothetical protein [Paraburkholderia acidipaludis]|uniref:hypothetical protein n=1 Tax=Paraburkholderia acidipaludis TaxID=660537 RepID=UPI0012EB3F31|nr:hypothetical protein [Paraburkholderia acidipaludis]
MATYRRNDAANLSAGGKNSMTTNTSSLFDRTLANNELSNFLIREGAYFCNSSSANDELQKLAWNMISRYYHPGRSGAREIVGLRRYSLGEDAPHVTVSPGGRLYRFLDAQDV